MEKINDALKKLTNNRGFKERYDEMKEEIMVHPDIQHFLSAHQEEITNKVVDASLMKLYEFISQTKDCKECPSLEQCINLMEGYEPELILQGNNIDLQYHRCKRKLVDDEKRKQQRLIQSLHVPKDMLEASFANFDLDTDGRMHAFEYVASFADRYVSGKKMKGIYIYGGFGVGKSYLLGALANQLAEKRIPSMLVYVPEFLREMKQSLADRSLDKKLDVVKKAPILMLDDIGAESMSSWARDEVLGAILQFRMHEHLPTFFSSNFNLDELKHHLTYSQRGEVEEMKAARMIERIKYLAMPIRIDGPNRRN